MRTETERNGNAPMQVEREVTLRDYLELLQRRYWIILAVLAVTLGGAVGLSLTPVPMYHTSTTLATDKTPPLVLMDSGGEISLFPDQAAAQTPDVQTLTQLIWSEVVRDGAIARLEPTLGRKTAQSVIGGMRVRPMEDAQIVRIDVQHTDPKAAALGANAIAESVIDMNLKARRRRVTETRQYINRQLTMAREKLAASEVAIVVFKNRHGDVLLEQETSLKLRKIADLEAERVAVRLPRIEQQSLIAALQGQLAALEIELYGLSRTLTPKHPTVITTEGKIAETKRRLEAELARNRQAEQSREHALTTAINRYEAQVLGVPPREAQLVRLTRNLKEAEQIYLLLSTKLQHAHVAEASIGSAIQVVDVAKVPETPMRSGSRRTILLGAILGLALGGGLALGVEQLDDKVRSAEDVESVLGAPVLGAIPFRSGGKRGTDARNGSTRPLPVLAQLGAQSPEAEAYRALRTHVLSAIADDGHKCLLVTSSLPREGKSTIAANLALALTRTDRQVWLLDGDLRHSSLSRLFPEARSVGLTAFLAGETKVDDAIRRAEQPGLWFIGSGAAVPNPTELLGNQRMTLLIGEARARADVTVVDSSAALPVTDAEVIGAQVDAVLMVVRVGKTDRRALAEARQRLDRVGVRVVGAVLNFVPAGRSGRYYNTHYHAYYGLNGEYDHEPGVSSL